MSDNRNTTRFEVPEGHLVVGYVAHLKVLDEEGKLYFSARQKDVNDMEALGLSTDMANSWSNQLQWSKGDSDDQ